MEKSTPKGDLCCKLCWYNGKYSKGEEVHHIIPRDIDDTYGVLLVQNVYKSDE